MKEGAVECKGCGNVYPVTQEKCEYCGRVNPARIVDPTAAADASSSGGLDDALNQVKTSLNNARMTILKEGSDILNSVSGNGQQASSPPPVPLDEIYPRTPPQPANPPKEHVSIGVCILSFFIPVFGLVYFLTMRKKKKKTAVIALILCAVNFIGVLSNSFSNGM